MADANTAGTRRGGSTEERLAPLWEAAREPTSGRIRSLPEARSALRIPATAEPDVLRAWGQPADFQLVAFAVDDPAQPQLVAEFAVLRVIHRQGRELQAAEPRTRLPARAKSNLLWIVYGSIVQAADHTLVLESLSIGPAFEGQLSRKGDDIAHGVTAQLLRLLSPARLLAQTVEHLQRQRYQLERAEHQGGPPMPAAQRATLQQIEAGRPRGARVSAEETASIARLYLTLCQNGNKHPLPLLASKLGITREQARDRVHNARKQGYLKPGNRGRAGAEPGPKLKGWNPQIIHPPAADQ
jgi:biotin operon repressor